MTEIQTRMTQLADPTGKTASAGAAVATAPAAATANPETATAFAQALTAAAPATPGTTGSTKGDAVVEDAKKYLGVPYVWGGTNPKTGLDCSGLVQLVYKDLGINLPRVAVDQGNAGTTVPNLAAAKPGDLLVMHNGGHIGIYMGDNKYIHAPMPGQVVQIAELPKGAVFDKITRIIPAEAAAPPAPPAASAQATFLSGLTA